MGCIYVKLRAVLIIVCNFTILLSHFHRPRLIDSDNTLSPKRLMAGARPYVPVPPIVDKANIKPHVA